MPPFSGLKGGGELSIRILIADDHRIMREGLRSLLESQDGIEVVGEAENGRDAVQLARELAPQVIIMDIVMPGLNGIEATRMIKADSPGTKVVALSMISEHRSVVEMLKAGSRGYLLKSECTLEELVRCIHTVFNGGIYLNPVVADLVVTDYLQHLHGDGSIFSILTNREREVFQLLAEGKSAREVASVLHLSRKTVDTHRRKIMNKLGIQTTTELMRYAVKEGIPLSNM